MSRISMISRLSAVAVFLLAGTSWAGTPLVPVIVQSADDAYAFASPGAGQAITVPITLTFNANSTTAEAALLSAIGVSGSGYSVVGGTCIAGTTALNASTPTSCTVIVQYQPASSSANNGLLTITCSTIGITGGFSVTCAPNSGSISLLGSVLAAIATRPAPALDPRLLTLLAALLLGVGAYYAARRNG
jgi:hypothetical protein